MSKKVIIQVGLLAGLGLFLFSRYANGSLSYYIHPRFNVLTLLTAAGLVVVAIAYGREYLLKGESHHEHQRGDYHAHDDHHHDHQHAHDHSHDLSWLGLALLAIPSILGFFVQPRPLGASALSNREVSVGTLSSVRAPEGSYFTTIATSGERNIMDWLYAFQNARDPGAFDGEEAHVIGFVYRDDRFDADTFMVSRFTVSCCVADAAPVGLIVRWPKTPELADDEWVEVTGPFEVGRFGDTTVPILVADSVVKTDPPAQPYLYQ